MPSFAPITTASFGPLPDGRPTFLYTLENAQLRVSVTDFGGRLVSVETPDRTGARAHVLLGFENATMYSAAGGSFGAILGRCANRIGGGRFKLDGREYCLATNEGSTTLHGGPGGFGQALWRAAVEDGPMARLVLAYISPAGDQGFPGTVTVQATYQLDGDTIWLTLEAGTDADTVVNLSSHPYFNLAGVEQHDVLGHEITIDADRFVPTDARQLPTGEIRAVSGTPFDFRAPRRLGARIRENDVQLLAGRGYDTCFVLNGGTTSEPRMVASARDPVSGRGLDIITTQPGLQLYSGNSLTGSIVGRGGIALRQSSGFAFEAQGFPDAPNHPNFTSVTLRLGGRYRQVIGYRFTA